MFVALLGIGVVGFFAWGALSDRPRGASGAAATDSPVSNPGKPKKPKTGFAGSCGDASTKNAVGYVSAGAAVGSAVPAVGTAAGAAAGAGAWLATDPCAKAGIDRFVGNVKSEAGKVGDKAKDVGGKVTEPVKKFAKGLF